MGAAGYGRVRVAVRVCGCAEAFRGFRDDWKGFGRKVRRWGRRGVWPRRTGRRVRGVAMAGSCDRAGKDGERDLVSGHRRDMMYEWKKKRGQR